MIPGSRFTEDTTVLEDGDTAVRVFYQAVADQITVSVGLESTGVWNSSTVPIPDA